MIEKEELKQIIFNAVIKNKSGLYKKDFNSLDDNVKSSLIYYTHKCDGDFREKIYWLFNNIHSYPICAGTCNKPIKKFSSFNVGYLTKFCYKCSKQHIFSKMKAANLLKYGNENPFASELGKCEIKKTNLERYGAESSLSNKEVREKVKKTNLEKYGHINPFGSSEIKSKIKETNLFRFGVENVFASVEVQNKIKETNLKKYNSNWFTSSNIGKKLIREATKQNLGVENPFSSLQIREKIKQTMIKKYGVENPMQYSLFINKAIQTRLQKYGVKYCLQSPNFSNSFRFKHIIINNVEYLYQGYELVAIKELLNTNRQFVNSRKEVPNIKYSNNKIYFPDFFLPQENLVIEIKSEYTYYNERWFEINQLKALATINAGFKFEFWVCSNSKILQVINIEN